MPLAMLLPQLTATIHGIGAPLLWIIGLVLIVAGVVGLFRGSLFLGIVLIVIGIVIGGLNVL